MSEITTDVSRVHVAGRFALVTSREKDVRHRTVRIYDLEAKHLLRNIEGYDKKGQFVTSYYLQTLINHDLTAASNEHGLNMHTAIPEWKIPASDWPAVVAYLKVMSR